jgi:uroporphyrinogen decarboxylase
MLSPVDYQELLEIHQSDYRSFGRSCSSNCFEKDVGLPNEMGKSRASALGVDWTCSPRNARYLSGNITLQGNFDPSRLLSHPKFMI